MFSAAPPVRSGRTSRIMGSARATRGRGERGGERAPPPPPPPPRPRPPGGGRGGGGGGGEPLGPPPLPLPRKGEDPRLPERDEVTGSGGALDQEGREAAQVRLMPDNGDVPAFRGEDRGNPGRVVVGPKAGRQHDRRGQPESSR